MMTVNDCAHDFRNTTPKLAFADGNLNDKEHENMRKVRKELNKKL